MMIKMLKVRKRRLKNFWKKKKDEWKSNLSSKRKKWNSQNKICLMN